MLGEPRPLIGQEMRWVAGRAARRPRVSARRRGADRAARPMAGLTLDQTPSPERASGRLADCSSGRARARTVSGHGAVRRAVHASRVRRRRSAGAVTTAGCGASAGHDGHRRRRLREVAMHVGHRDRPPERGRTRRARHDADLPIARADDVASGGNGAGRLERQPDQALRDPALAAVQHADDDLLSDVAALGQADGAVLDAGFERNRLLVHVDAELRAACLRCASLPRSRHRRRPRPPSRSRRDDCACLRRVDEQIEAVDPDVVAAHDDHRAAAVSKRRLAVERHRLETRGIGLAAASATSAAASARPPAARRRPARARVADTSSTCASSLKMD